MNLTTFIASEKDSRCLMISWKSQIEISVTEKKGIRIITRSRSTYSTVLCYMIMLCMSIFLTIFRSFFFSLRLVFSKGIVYSNV